MLRNALIGGNVPGICEEINLLWRVEVGDVSTCQRGCGCVEAIQFFPQVAHPHQSDRQQYHGYEHEQ